MATKQEKVVDKLKNFYEEFGDADLDELDSIYDEEVAFNDPIHGLETLKDLKKVYKAMLENVKYCRFVFEDEFVGKESAYLVWQMRLSHEKLAGGAEIVLPGSTHLRFTDDGKKIRHHHDYYDLGAMVYEHIPVVSWIVGKVKSKLENQ